MFIQKIITISNIRNVRSISLVGGVCKLIAMMLARGLKGVARSEAGKCQHTFLGDRLILEASLIANKIDRLQKSGTKGEICKLNMKKAYHHMS